MPDDNRKRTSDKDTPGKPTIGPETHDTNIGQRGGAVDRDDADVGGKPTVSPETRDANVGQRPTRDDGDNDDKGELD